MKTEIFKKLLLLSIGILGISYYSFLISENIFSSEVIKPIEIIPVSKNIISTEITLPVEIIPVFENIIFTEVIKPIEIIPVSKKIISDFPVRLKIPKIGIDTDVINVGITPTGILDTPKDIKTAGLYNLGPSPGEEGSAVIDGHYGRINKNPAVFNNLFKLQKGDEIFFHDEKGNIITFIVDKIKIYEQSEATTEIFNSNDGKSHLNIITCEGVWDKAKQSYSNRLVVFSDKLIK